MNEVATQFKRAYERALSDGDHAVADVLSKVICERGYFWEDFSINILREHTGNDSFLSFHGVYCQMRRAKTLNDVIINYVVGCLKSFDISHPCHHNEVSDLTYDLRELGVHVNFCQHGAYYLKKSLVNKVNGHPELTKRFVSNESFQILKGDYSLSMFVPRDGSRMTLINSGSSVTLSIKRCAVEVTCKSFGYKSSFLHHHAPMFEVLWMIDDLLDGMLFKHIQDNKSNGLSSLHKGLMLHRLL